MTAHYADRAIGPRRPRSSKETYGYLVIPPQFRDRTCGPAGGPRCRYYYHYALLSVGSEVRGAFETVLQPLSMGPIVSEATALGVSESTVTEFSGAGERAEPSAVQSRS